MEGPAPCVFVLFGATGDLARRKLIPALYNLQRDNLLPKNFAVCAYARKPKSDEQFRDDLKAELTKFSRQTPGEDWKNLADRIYYVQGEFDNDAAWGKLKTRLEEIDKSHGTKGNRLFYFAVDSEYFVPIVERISKNKLLIRARAPLAHDPHSTAEGASWQRIILEKPIGHDSASAREMMQKVAEHTSESQVYRIDHYLGKETVQNILALRFGNGIFEPLWNQKYVDHVQITVAEKEGVGTRAGYYDGAGATRDILQNHVLQLLCLVAMEAPGTMSADDIRNEKVKVLRNLREMTPKQVEQNTVRGQYGPSTDGKMKGYRTEEGVKPESVTETYAAFRCFIDTWRWAGVPFLLRTGKAMPRRESQISIHFRLPPLQLFDDGPNAALCAGNVLTIYIQPDEGISMELAAKIPGAGMKLKHVEMDFDYKEAFHQKSPEAYERLLLDAMSGDATLFTRDDEVLAQWAFVDSILKGWAELPAPRFPNYFAGTWGPDDANSLVPTCSRGWHMEREG